MNRPRRTGLAIALAALVLSAASPLFAQDAPAAAAAKPKGKPIKALLVLGGCCHDYKRQAELITKGISERANVEWTIALDPDTGTKHLNPVYEKDDWAKGFDVIVHDECSADVKDKDVIERVLKPHKEGLPAVFLHCAMHSFRGEGFPKDTEWFKLTGLHTTGHGPQLPIAIDYGIAKDHPAVKGLENWTTGKEELYNNVEGKVIDTATPLATGTQTEKGKETKTVITWVNTYNGKAKVFGTTLGHNNTTVGDPRYLNLITRGLLWSLDKLDDEHFKASDKPAEAAEEKKAAGDPKKELLKPDAKPPAAKADANGMVPVDLARGKKVTASSHQNENTPESAVDGDADTRWCAEDGSVPQWLQVDLGKPETLTGVRITWEKDDAIYWHKIEASADGKAWKLLSDQTNSQEKSQVRELKLADKPGDIRFLKLTVSGTGPGAWASLFSLEALGTELVKATAAPKTAAKPQANKGGDPAKGEFDPEAALKQVKVPAGFTAKMFAGPPDVSYPTCVAIGDAGQLFVGIDEQGSLGKTPGRGRVVLATDKDGDGKADAFVDFAKMDHPRGLTWDASTNSLYVLHPPFLTKFVDENGDGVSDRSEVMITGIANTKMQAERGADHTTNGMRLGIDGWLYIAMGDFGTQEAVAAKDGAKLQMHGGGVVRVRLDGSGLEDYSFGQRNIYDVAVDPFLNCFTRDNTNDGGGWDVRLSHVIPTGNYGYPRLFQNFNGEAVQPLDIYGGGSPCGSLFVDEPGIPGPWGNGFYSVEWGRSIVYRHPLTANGAGFKAGQEKFLDVPRGTDMDVDGSGNFYVSSWANGGFSYSGPNVGYVVRVAATDAAKSVSALDMKTATDDQLVQAVGSNSAVAREAAQREIVKRGDNAALAAGLEKLAASAALPQARVAAIFSLRQLRSEKSYDKLIELTKDDAVREFALRALADRVGDPAVPTAPFVAGLTDASPRVRLIAAWGLARIGKADVATAVLPLTADADPLVSHVAINTLVTLKAADACLKAVDSANPSFIPGALRVLQGLHETKVVDGLIAKLAGMQDVALRAQIYTTLARLYNDEAAYDGGWWGTRPDTSGPYYKTAEWEGTPKIKAALTAALANEKPEVVRTVLLQLPRHKIKLPEAAPLIAKLIKTDPAFKALALETASGAAQLGVEDVVLLSEVAKDESASAESRVKALRTLAKSDLPAAREAAADGFGAIAVAEKAEKSLTGALDEFLRDAKHADRIADFAKLANAESPARREIGHAVLVSLAANNLVKEPKRAEASKAIELSWATPGAKASLLRAVGRAKAQGYNDRVTAAVTDKDAKIAAAGAFAAQRLGIKAAGGTASAKMLIEAMPYEKTLEIATKEKGDSAVGAEVFVRQGCVACHTTKADEPPKGPFLGGISARYNRAELAESIVKPNAKISQGFETQWFRTADDIVEGFVTREAGDEIEFGNATGAATILKTKDVAKRGKRETSIMPEGLVGKISPQELASLLAYLESLKAK